MTFYCKIFFLPILLFFGCKIYAQTEKNITPLKEILFSIENKYKVSFNFLENDVKNILILPPPKRLNLTKKIAYLEEKSGLSFAKINPTIFSIHSNKKKFKICGFIYSKAYDLPISEALVILENGEKTTSDSNGYYEFIAESSQDYTILTPDYNTEKISGTNLISGEISHIFLNEKIKEIDGVILNKYISSSIVKNKDGSYQMTPKKEGVISGLIEPDVLQTMLHLPGIYSTDESLSNISVRSGTNDQNYILWNGIKLYQTAHFFGMISTINPYLSNEIKIYKNASPAFYGEGIASVVDISTDKNFSTKNKYSFGINMLNADIYTKINISKNSFLEFATRKSYTEFLQTPTYQEYFKKIFQNSTVTNFSTNENINYSTDKNFNFYDISTKFVQKIGEKNLISLDFINIYDKLNVTQENSITDTDYPTKNIIYQRNLGTNISWNHDWNKKNSSFVNLSNSQYELDSQLINYEDTYANKRLENYVYDNSLKIGNAYKINDKYLLNTGYQLTLLNTKNITEDKSISSFSKEKQQITEHAIYAETKFKDSLSHVNLMVGIRTNYISPLKKIILEPRFQFTYDFSKYFDVNLLAEIKSQLISQQIEQQYDFFGVEKRWWALANNNTIPIQKSKQISLGAGFNKNNWLVTLETYYRKVTGINSAAQSFQNQFQYAKTIGNYDVKGIELLVQKKIKHFLLWTNYNFTNSNYTFPELFPQKFTSNFEINHLFSFGANYEKKRYKVALGAKWHSGKPETEIVNNQINQINYSDPQVPSINYDVPNQKYLSHFFQVDASASYKFRTTKNLQYNFDISILNLLNKKNEINEYYRINATNHLIEQIKSYSISRTFNAGFRISF